MASCLIGAVIHGARVDAAKSNADSAKAATGTFKNDLVRLMHLYKDPDMQIHWANYFGVLSRRELDARKSAKAKESSAANAANYLASRFNDYVNFAPQNLMVAYHQITREDGIKITVKRNPFKVTFVVYTICFLSLSFFFFIVFV